MGCNNSTPIDLYKEHRRYLGANWYPGLKTICPADFDKFCKLDSVNGQRFVDISFNLQIALILNQYDYIQDFLTNASFNKLLSTYLTIKNGQLLAGGRDLCLFSFAPIWTFLVFDNEKTYREPKEVSKYLDLFRSNTFLFNCMCADLHKCIIKDTRAFVYPLYFDILKDLMSTSFITKDHEFILLDLYQYIMELRQTNNEDNIGLYNNFLDSLLQDPYQREVFFKLLNQNSKQGVMGWFNKFKVDLSKDFWVRNAVLERQDLDELNDFNNLKSLLDSTKERDFHRRCEMYKIHTE